MSKKPFPKFTTPDYKITLPISGKDVIFRAYNVADERLLVAAAAAKDEDADFYARNTIKVIQNTIINDVNVGDLPSMDVRFLMLHLRGRSVGEEIEVTLPKQGVTAINVNDFFIDGLRDKAAYKIQLTPEMGILMREQTFAEEIACAIDSGENRADIIFKMMIDSVAALYDKDDVWYVGEDITKDDVTEFIGSIPSGDSAPLYEFIRDMPVIAVNINIINDEGVMESVKITNREVDFLS